MKSSAHNFKWDEPAIRSAAKKFQSRGEFEVECASAVASARKKFPGLLDELFPRKLRVAWTEETVRNEALKYSSKKEFQDKCSSGEAAARRFGILDDLGFKRPVQSRFKWTEEAIRVEALKYSTKREFEKFARGASERARVIGIIDDLGLLEYPPSDNDTIYMWRAVGQYFNSNPVYKIGVTSARLGLARINQVSKASGFESQMIFVHVVAGKASSLESKLLAMGDDPRYTGFNGASEFRAFNSAALEIILEIVSLAIDKDKALL